MVVGRRPADRPSQGRKYWQLFSLELAGAWISNFDLLEVENDHPLELRRLPEAGDPAPDITLVDVSSGQKVRLSDFKGRVVFVDFWATWCGPCQLPMGKLNDIVSRRTPDWDGKAVVLPVSLDDKADKLRRHVEQRGWRALRHLWCGDGKPGFESTAARTYGIRGVPTALLIDPAGKIAWRGHPRDVDPEVRVDALVPSGGGNE